MKNIPGNFELNGWKKKVVKLQGHDNGHGLKLKRRRAKRRKQYSDADWPGKCRTSSSSHTFIRWGAASPGFTNFFSSYLASYSVRYFL